MDEVLGEAIDAKYSNRILDDLGLCICLYSLETEGPAFIHPNTGCANYKTHFKIVVFRPFIGEVLTGRLVSCTKDGIKVSLGFFENVLVPSYLLQQPSEFDEKERVWVWKYKDEDEDDEGEDENEEADSESQAEQRLTMEKNDLVRFRVRSLEFTRIVSSGRGKLQVNTTSDDAAIDGDASGSPPCNAVRHRSTSVDLTQDDEIPIPMRISGAMNEEGLGLVNWWT